ncbi:phosphotransferase family protein [Actinomadura oligospora]|uniref:phosphotransferase family protein n=1 Tax=Actinomadura oligospora TaxID=111804 RepID=UPI00047A1DA0|nr:hypothetical protein [Actinomadura oligospora]
MEALIRAVHPDAEIVGLIPRTGGESAPVVEVVCANPSVRLIVKTFPDDQGWKLLKECRVYGLLPDDVPTPRVLHASRDPLAMVLTSITGRPLTEVSEFLPADALGSLYAQMGRILAVPEGLHSVGGEEVVAKSRVQRHAEAFSDVVEDPVGVGQFGDGRHVENRSIDLDAGAGVQFFQGLRAPVQIAVRHGSPKEIGDGAGRS